MKSVDDWLDLPYTIAYPFISSDIQLVYEVKMISKVEKPIHREQTHGAYSVSATVVHPHVGHLNDRHLDVLGDELFDFRHYCQF